MEVFISWSGTTSLEIANTLHGWLRLVIQNIVPWVSDIDIDKGDRWYIEISAQLEIAKYGLVCFTPDNLNSHWILFESGALAKSLEKARVVPLLFQVSKKNLPEPLSQFQAVDLENEAEVRALMKNLNKAIDASKKGSTETRSLAEPILETAFDAFWPRLEKRLNKIAAKRKESESSLETNPVELADLWEISTKTESKLGDITAALNAFNDKAARYLIPWEKQDPRQLAQRLEQAPEAVYLYNASRFGVGHVNVSFTCEIRDDGAANVWREVTVEAFSRIQSLYAYLARPVDEPEECFLDVGELIPIGSDPGVPRISLDKQDVDSRHQTAVNLIFSPPLRPGEIVGYRLSDTAVGPVFPLTSARLGPEEDRVEVFGWSVDRPTKRLELKLVFPPGYEPTVFFPEVKRSSSSGFQRGSHTTIHEYETIRVNRPNLSVPDEQNRRTLSMTVDYPMTGLIYTMRWEPVSRTQADSNFG